MTVLGGLSGEPWINSGMMFITEDDAQAPFDYFLSATESVMEQCPAGDQVFLHKFWADRAARWQDKYPWEIVSYKRDILKQGFLGREQVVLFHGKPRPWDINEQWIPAL